MKGYGNIRTAKDYLAHVKARGDALAARRQRERAKLAQSIYFAGLPRPTPEYRFHPTRKWRFDWAWPDQRIAVEQEGGVWIRGRHTRGGGYLADLEKYNAAALMGWRVGRFTPQQVKSGEAAAWVKRLMTAA